MFGTEKVHGIQVARISQEEEEDGSEEAEEDDGHNPLNKILVLFWGGSKMVFTRLGALVGDESDSEEEDDLHFTEIAAMDWIYYAILIPRSGQTPSESKVEPSRDFEKGYIIVAITAHNTLLYYDISTDRWIGEVRNPERCILYSASLVYLPEDKGKRISKHKGQGGHRERVLVAAGTIFGDILVWSSDLDDMSLEPISEQSDKVDEEELRLPMNPISVNQESKRREMPPRRKSTAGILSDGEDWDQLSEDETWDQLDVKSAHSSGFSTPKTDDKSPNVQTIGAKNQSGPKLHYRLKGHQGSIFGVNISPAYELSNRKRVRYLASSSDDRTVRVWNISECDGPIQLENEDDDEGSEDTRRMSEWSKVSMDASIIVNTPTTSTGFSQTLPTSTGKDYENLISTGWGHGARVWIVQFLANRSPLPLCPTDGDKIKLISASEDLTSKLWSFDPESTGGVELQALETIQMHSGKNIWSMAVDEKWGLLATGGADSRVAIVGYGGSGVERKEWGFDEVMPQEPLPSGSSGDGKLVDEITTIRKHKSEPRADGFRDYVAVDKETLFVSTNDGSLLTYTFPYTPTTRFPGNTPNGQYGRWRLLGHYPNLRSYVAMSVWEGTGLVCVGDGHGRVGILDLDRSRSGNIGTQDGQWWKVHDGSVGTLFCGRHGGIQIDPHSLEYPS